jgi:hypothetical protein
LDQDKLHAGFVRNRRFFIAVSFALAAVIVLNLQFTQVNILGNSAVIKRPERVFFVCWVIWAWAFWQYVVWFRDVKGWTEFLAAIAEDTGLGLGRGAAATGSNPDWVIADLLQRLARHNLSDQLMMTVQYSREFMNITGDGKSADRVANVGVTAYVRLSDKRGEAREGPIRIEEVLSPTQWRVHFVIHGMKVLFTRRFVPEYFAPFIIGLLPVALWLLSKGHESTRL